MKRNRDMFIAAAVLASAMTATGCDKAMFTSANDTLKTIRTAGNSVGSARMPTAAIATAIGGLEIVKALSSDGTDAKNQGIIAAGGGNIIAAGGGNIIAAGGGNYDLLAFEVGKEITKTLSQNNVTGQLKYSSTADRVSNLIVSTFTLLNGNSGGYALTSAGTFKYGINADGNGGRVLCSMTGKIEKGDFKVDIKKVEINTFDPLPSDASRIGDFEIEGKDGEETIRLVASVGTKGGKISAKADVWVNGNKQDKKVSFGEDNPNFAAEETPAGN